MDTDISGSDNLTLTGASIASGAATCSAFSVLLSYKFLTATAMITLGHIIFYRHASWRLHSKRHE